MALDFPLLSYHLPATCFASSPPLTIALKSLHPLCLKSGLSLVSRSEAEDDDNNSNYSTYSMQEAFVREGRPYRLFPDSSHPLDPSAHSRKPKSRRKTRSNSISSLNNSIDLFLAGEYAHPFSPDAPAPHPGLGPGQTVEVSLRALRKLDEPYKSHGAAVFLRFCIPLTRGERWGGYTPPSHFVANGKIQNHHHNDNEIFGDNNMNNENTNLHWNKYLGVDPWKDLLRGALTPPMLARKLRASCEFSTLLDWTSLDVTEGASNPNPSAHFIGQNDVAYVNAGLFFERGVAPKIIHFVLKKVGTAWFIDKVLVGKENEDLEGDSWADGRTFLDSGLV